YLRLLNQRRTVNRGSVGNAITSMRTLSTTEWQAFVEHLSLVEQVLSQDPVGVYKQMDSATRDRYRHVVEKLSKQTQMPEARVAQEAINAAAHMPREDNRRAHVGYFLMDRGLKELRETIGYRAPLHDCASEWVLEHPTLFY